MIPLSRIQGLRSLVIEFSNEHHQRVAFNDFQNTEDSGEAHERFENRMKYLSRFSNLTRLTLLEICDNLQQWTNHLLQTLLNNSGLEHISLSVNNASMHLADFFEGNLDHDQRTYYRFFTDLCLQYGKKSDARLKLRSLRLASGICFPELQDLAQMVDATCIHEIFVCNW